MQNAADAPVRGRPSLGAKASVSGETYGALINLSGRRRFTSQRLVLYALLALRGRADALRISRDCLGTFEEAHNALVRGTGSLPGLFCDELRDAYVAQGGDAQIRAFIGLAQRCQDAIGRAAHGAPALVDDLVDAATPLLETLNRLTQLYEDLARRQAKTARTQLVDTMSEIEEIARQARIVAFNSQVIASRAGPSGREFAVVATELTNITTRIDGLVRQALKQSVGNE